jgi:hypothetical protein
LISKSNIELQNPGKKFSRIFFFLGSMINKDTPDKMREIIMDTWPQLYWLNKEKEKTNGRINVNTTKTKGVV